jgi:hypothetical protein
MRNRTLTLFALAVLALATTVASAQTIDLAMTEFSADWDGETLTLMAEISFTSHGSFEPVEAEVGYYLDSYHVGSALLHLEQIALGNCHEDTPPDCDGYCEPIYVDGQLITVYSCMAVNWSSPMCCCVYLVPVTPYLAPYHGEGTATVTVDPMGVHAEADETNNSMTIALGPIAGEARTWSQVKALYR